MRYFVLPAFHFSTCVLLAHLIVLRRTETNFTCPSECICNGLEVNCIGKNLKGIPTTIPLFTKKLKLANNNITALLQIELSYLNELIYLDCSHNQLNLSYPFAFPEMDQLTYLDLSYNNISYITAFTFKELNRLLFLNLSSNRSLKEIQDKTFDGNIMLRFLDMSNCGLTYLGGHLLEHLHNLNHLGLNGNPWVCDCDFLEFCTWMRESAVLYTDVSHVTCNNPESFRGLTLIEVEDKLHFDCLVHLDKDDFVYITLIGFCIFFGGTLVAWLVGVSTVIYSHFVVVKIEDDSDEEEQKII